MEDTLPFDPKMIATTNMLAGYEVVRSLGVVEGMALMVFGGLGPDMRALMFKDVLREAYLDMMRTAARQGAQAIVGLRYVLDSESVVMVYGTAVLVRAVDYRL